MSIREQQEIWEKRALNTTVDDVIAMYRSPCSFQVQFSEYMNHLGRSMLRKGGVRICELGCEFGIVSLLFSSEIFNRHCLDLNVYALKLLEKATVILGEKIELHHEDMFRTSFEDEMFDIIFNSGVLEHYSFEERRRALMEYARILRPGGMVVIGVPNHFSFPYRFAYKLRKLIHKWPYPPEDKIRDFSGEIRGVDSLAMVRVLFFDKETVFAILPKSNYTSLPFRILDKVFHFEPYLRVIELRKVLLGPNVAAGDQ